MKTAIIIALIPIVVLFLGCGQKENRHAVLLFGAKSTPNYEDVEVGVDIIKNGQILSVGGYGELATEEWGSLTYSYTNGKNYTFKKGGVGAWSPPGEDFKEISGDADIELFAYLLTATANDKLEPSSMIVREKWKIPQGRFKLKIKTDNKSEQATPSKLSD